MTPNGASRTAVLVPGGLAVASGGAYITLALLHTAEGTLRANVVQRTIGILLLASVIFWIAAWWNERHPLSWKWLWLPAIAFRVVLLFTSPTLSDDVYRYLWEGHLLTEGVSPYAASPIDPSLDEYEIDARDDVNNPMLASPYLPAAHAVFALLALLLPSDPLVMQLAMVAFELGAAFLLSRLLALAGLPAHRLLLWLWNPLVIIEVAHGAHLDALMAAGALGAALITLRPPEMGGRRWLGPLLLAAATLTRPLPLLMVPVLWWRWNNRERLLFGMLIVGAVMPFALWSGWGIIGDATGTGVFGSARVYSNDFRFNSGVFHLLEDRFSAGLARFVAGVGQLGALVFAFIVGRRGARALAPLRLMAIPMVAYVVLTPVLHPWYILLPIALAIFHTPADREPSTRWLGLAPLAWLLLTLPISYITYEDPAAFGERAWVRNVEWWPAWLLAAGILVGMVATSRRRAHR